MGKTKQGKFELSGLLNIFTMLLATTYSALALMLNSKYNCDALTLSILPCAFTILLLFFLNKEIKIEKNEKVFLHLFTALFMLMLSFIDIVRFTVKKMSDNQALRIVISVYFGLAIYICTYRTVKYIYAAFIRKRELRTNAENGKPYVMYTAFIAFAVVVFFLAAGYGYQFDDTVSVYSYIVDEGKWIDWHTISYQLLMMICRKILPNSPFVFNLILVQSILWVLVCNYALKSLYDEFKSVTVLKAYTLISFIIISPVYYAPVGFKDTVFSMFMFSFAISIFNVIRKENVTAKDYVLLAVNATLASLFRHIAVEIVVVSLVVLFVYRFIRYKNKKDIKKYIAIALTPVIVFTGITVGIGDYVLHKSKNPDYVKYTIPIYLTAACASKLGDEFEEENRKVLERYYTTEEWAEFYEANIYWADTVTRYWGGVGEKVLEFDDEFLSGIMKVNVSLVLHHPREYIESIFEITSIVWRIGDPNDCTTFYPNAESVKNYEYYKPSVAADIIPSYINFSESNTLLRCVTWRGGIWILAAIYASFVLIKKRRAELLLMILPVVLYAASLFISIPAQDPRYVLCFVEVGMFYAVTAFFQNKKDNTKELQDS